MGGLDDGRGVAAPDADAPGPLGSRALAYLRSSVVARFASVGVVNTVVDFGLYVLLFALGLAPFLANFLSTSAGMAVSFAGNRRFVFGATDNRSREIALFVVVCGLGIWGVQPLVIHGVTRLLTDLDATSPVILGPVPKVVAIGVAAVWNYVLYSRVVFRNGEVSQDGREPA